MPGRGGRRVGDRRLLIAGVLGAIPAEQERNAVNGVETYRLRPGTKDVVDTTYVFREGTFDGELVTLRPTGYVEADGGGVTAQWFKIFDDIALAVMGLELPDGELGQPVPAGVLSAQGVDLLVDRDAAGDVKLEPPCFEFG